MTTFRYRLYGVWFVLRNWRYHHSHGALLAGLREAATDTPPTISATVTYDINVSGTASDALEELAMHREMQSTAIELGRF